MLPAAEIDTNSLFALVISTLLGGSAVAAWSQLRKSRPEAEAIGMGSLINVNAELRTEIDRLTESLDRARKQIDRQETRIRDQGEELQVSEGRIRALTLELDDLEHRLSEMGH